MAAALPWRRAVPPTPIHRHAWLPRERRRAGGGTRGRRGRRSLAVRAARQRRRFRCRRRREGPAPPPQPPPRPAPPGAMEVTVGTAALALALLLLPVLYERSGSFRFFCKMGFYNGWILLLALVAIPLCALRGRDVENMKDDGGAAGPLRAHRQAGAALHGGRGGGLLARRHHLHRPQADARRHQRHGGGRPHHAQPGRPRRPHRHLLLPALLQQAGAEVHGRAVRDPGAAPAAHPGAGPGRRPGAHRAGPRCHAGGLRGALGRAVPHGAAPRPPVTRPTAARCPMAPPGPTAAGQGLTLTWKGTEPPAGRGLSHA
ncbi:1-acyl-sn-glycerol-3-phosphate acyltransferase alpha isoform X3 [Calonectris borealis]|uniref:1-acyl-sn-glycerol-3-phosphate acyltransferase alpha isoform X3 n=1 Tax=Calonectris borealis TaxID=1323832 RepID=UPI003F4C7011